MLNLVAGILTSRRGVIMLRTTCRTWHALLYNVAHFNFNYSMVLDSQRTQ